MIERPTEWLEKYRVVAGRYASGPAAGNNGMFQIPSPYGKLTIIASNGGGWEHVSVSYTRKKDEIPSWEVMCFCKRLFWSDDECVVQYHPPESEYVNNHPSVLHLWKPVGIAIPMPPKSFV